MSHVIWVIINGESLKERTNKPSSLSYKSTGEVKVKALPGSVNVKHAKSQITFSKYGLEVLMQYWCGTGVVLMWYLCHIGVVPV